MKLATVKRYAISTLVTFLAGFSLVMLPELNNLNQENLSNGVLVGVLLAGVRAGIKSVLEAFLVWYNK